MKIFNLNEKLLNAVVEFIEKEDIVHKLNLKLNEIKNKKINISLFDRTYVNQFHFKKNIFSHEEEIFLNSVSIDYSYPYLNTYLNNGYCLNIVDSLGIYQDYYYKLLKKSTKSEIFYEENLKMEYAVYLDYNVLLRFEEYKEKIKEILKENEKLFLVYSDIHIAEILCIEESNEKKETISKVCLTVEKYINNILIKDSRIYKIDFIKLLKPLKNLSTFLKIVRIIKVLEYSDLDYGFYNKDDITNKIIDFIKKQKITSEVLNNMTLEEIFEKYPFLQSQFYELSKTEEFSPIFSIMLFMDCIGYNKDKKFRTMISSFFDELHLEYAIKAKYFITKDKILGKKASEIFKYLKVDTKVYII